MEVFRAALSHPHPSSPHPFYRTQSVQRSKLFEDLHEEMMNLAL
jgi:hypothetical protein